MWQINFPFFRHEAQYTLYSLWFSVNCPHYQAEKAKKNKKRGKMYQAENVSTHNTYSRFSQISLMTTAMQDGIHDP